MIQTGHGWRLIHFNTCVMASAGCPHVNSRGKSQITFSGANERLNLRSRLFKKSWTGSKDCLGELFKRPRTISNYDRDENVPQIIIGEVTAGCMCDFYSERKVTACLFLRNFSVRWIYLENRFLKV